MDTNKIIHLAAKVGKLMLENGAETYRVEETIDRICKAYGLHEAESFVTTTGIILSITEHYGKTTSIVRRIKNRKVDLEKISKLNDLSRNIKVRGLTSDDIIVIFSSLGAAFFTLLFGGI